MNHSMQNKKLNRLILNLFWFESIQSHLNLKNSFHKTIDYRFSLHDDVSVVRCSSDLRFVLLERALNSVSNYVNVNLLMENFSIFKLSSF